MDEVTYFAGLILRCGIRPFPMLSARDDRTVDQVLQPTPISDADYEWVIQYCRRFIECLRVAGINSSDIQDSRRAQHVVDGLRWIKIEESKRADIEFVRETLLVAGAAETRTTGTSTGTIPSSEPLVDRRRLQQISEGVDMLVRKTDEGRRRTAEIQSDVVHLLEEIRGKLRAPEPRVTNDDTAVTALLSVYDVVYGLSRDQSTASSREAIGAVDDIKNKVIEELGHLRVTLIDILPGRTLADSSLHQVISTVDPQSGDIPGVIVDVVRSGFRKDGAILRLPAVVAVKRRVG